MVSGVSHQHFILRGSFFCWGSFRYITHILVWFQCSSNNLRGNMKIFQLMLVMTLGLAVLCDTPEDQEGKRNVPAAIWLYALGYNNLHSCHVLQRDMTILICCCSLYYRNRPTFRAGFGVSKMLCWWLQGLVRGGVILRQAFYPEMLLSGRRGEWIHQSCRSWDMGNFW